MTGASREAYGAKHFKEEYSDRLQYLLSTEEFTQDVFDKLSICEICYKRAKELGEDIQDKEMCCYYCTGTCQNPKCIHSFNESFRKSCAFLRTQKEPKKQNIKDEEYKAYY